MRISDSTRIATAAQRPNALPILSKYPAVVGGFVIVLLLWLLSADKKWKPVAVLVGAFVLLSIVSAGATGGAHP